MARLRTRVRQYPSIITWQTEGTPVTQDPVTGDIIPGTPGIPIESKCRYENFTSGNRREFKGVDGRTVLATGAVYIKFGEEKPPRFVIAEITTDGRTIYKGEVMNTFEGQMNKTIYTIEDVRT